MIWLIYCLRHIHIIKLLFCINLRFYIWMILFCLLRLKGLLIKSIFWLSWPWILTKFKERIWFFNLLLIILLWCNCIFRFFLWSIKCETKVTKLIVCTISWSSSKISKVFIKSLFPQYFLLFTFCFVLNIISLMIRNSYFKFLQWLLKICFLWFNIF